MSLILEALRKSEAERRVGRPPGLLSPMPAAHRTPRPAVRWPWLAAAVAALLLVGAGAWWLGRHAAPAESAAIADADLRDGGSVGRADQATADIASAPVAPSDTPASARDTPTRNVPAPRPLQPGEFPPPPMSGEGPMERESRAQIAAQARLPAPASIAPAPAAASESNAGTAARPAMPTAALPMPPPQPVAPPASTQADGQSQAPSQSAATAPASTRPNATTAADSAPLEALPRVADLDAATRERLPPLKVSMHVFAEAPAARFVLIDGRRLAEGDRVAHGITVDEIRRDGTVLRLDDRRILLPRP